MSSLLCWILLYYSAIIGLTSLSTEGNPYTESLKQRPWESVQNYLEVRRGAFIFYWFYYADGTSAGAESKPLAIWIQGGPGFAATGLANFAEIGPLNMGMEPRNHTWVNGINVLLLDHPVGTGFSYVKNKSLLVKTDREMAMDLAKAIKLFLRENRKFRRTPTYLFGQSYGGKLCPRLAYYLHTAIERKSLKMNLKGIGIGSGWVSPSESSKAMPTFLYNMGVIDRPTYVSLMNVTRYLCHYIEKQNYKLARIYETKLQHIIIAEAEMDINFNNVNQVSPYPALDELNWKVNAYVKPTLPMVDQALQWNYKSEEAYDQLVDSFLVPSTKFLETILNTTKIKVAIYNGNLDIITPLAGATNWVHKLNWPGAEEFRKKTRTKIRGYRNGFYKKVQQLSFWSVFGSGHWVPEDNPTAMFQILEDIMMDDFV